eukprot:scaffold167915_cov19-Tisochrysis_lutea.AAC.1
MYASGWMQRVHVLLLVQVTGTFSGRCSEAQEDMQMRHVKHWCPFCANLHFRQVTDPYINIRHRLTIKFSRVSALASRHLHLQQVWHLSSPTTRVIRFLACPSLCVAVLSFHKQAGPSSGLLLGWSGSEGLQGPSLGAIQR